MTFTRIPIAVLLLGLASPIAPVVAGDKDTLDKLEYYPLKVGTTWEYQINGKKSVTTVAGHEKHGEFLLARLETTMDGAVATEHVTMKEGFVIRVVANGQEIRPPWRLIKVSPKVGDKWDFESQNPNLPIKGTFGILEAKKLKVGDKEYDTVQVTSSGLKFAGLDVEMKTWYAKDVGMVKQTLSQPSAGLDFTLELKQFTAGK